MAHGLKVWDASGGLVFDSSVRMYRVLTVATASDNGSFTSAELGKGTPIIGMNYADDLKKSPTVSVSGNTVSWSYGSTAPADRDTASRVIVGVF